MRCVKILAILILTGLAYPAQNKAETKNEFIERVNYKRTYGSYNLPEVVVTAKLSYSQKILLLAKLINAEAGHESFEGKIAVANVVINRSKRKKMSIKNIIYQRDKKGNPQFDGIDSKRFHYIPKKSDILAAKQAFIKEVVPSTVEFFHNPITSTDKGWVGYISNYKYKQIGRYELKKLKNE